MYQRPLYFNKNDSLFLDGTFSNQVSLRKTRKSNICIKTLFLQNETNSMTYKAVFSYTGINYIYRTLSKSLVHVVFEYLQGWRLCSISGLLLQSLIALTLFFSFIIQNLLHFLLSCQCWLCTL